MGFSAAGAELGLTAATGGAAAGSSAVTCKLHTAATPSASNELSGEGYSDADLTPADLTISTVSGHRRLSFPAMEWFSDATGAAQTAQSLALWHGSTLIWHREMTITPDNQEVSAVANAIYLEVDLDETSWVWTADGLDRFLQAIRGSGVSSITAIWELHSATPPASANRLTGGGIDGIDDAAWSFTTVSGFRRRRQAALSWSGWTELRTRTLL